MVAGALDALVGGTPSDEVVEAALSTIPAAEVPGALRALVREHGPAALPVLRAALGSRPAWAAAAAAALGGLAAPAAAEALAAAERSATDREVRTALRRALYRLRQAGVTPAPPAPVRAPRARAREAWASQVDGTGTAGVWLLLEGPLGERTLLSAIVSDETGVLEAAAGPVSRKRLESRLAALRAESSLPWAAVPPAWALARLDAARALGVAPGETAAALARGLDGLARSAAAAETAPPAVPEDPGDPAGAAQVLALPELAGWFLEPADLQAEALERLQARESRLVVSPEARAERASALVDRVAERAFVPAARARWAGRLEHAAVVLAGGGRTADAARADAARRALADAAREARGIPFVRALVERSLEVAEQVALGKLAPEAVRRAPRAPGPAGRP
jgi:hypothetical protein